MSRITSLREESTLPNAVAPDWLLGWRYERVRRADGREIEITSPATRETDRVKKVKDYALVGVQEYIYIDHTTRRGKEIWEIAGFRLDGDRYLPMLPDEDGAYFCETVGLRISLEEGRVWLEDVNTGEELLTAQQVSAARDAEAARANAEAEARKAAEARAAELEATIAALQQKA